MATKTYRTYYLKSLQFFTTDEKGNQIEVNFRGGMQIDSTAKFSTSDEKIQKALENSSCFNRDYYIESVQEDVKEPQPETPAEAAMPQGESNTRVVTVADKADAIEWLKENYADKGYTATKLRTQTAFEEACKECNVQFQFTA